MHSKFIKQRHYKAVRNKEIPKEHFEINRPKDFSDLVASNLRQENDNIDSEGLAMINNGNFSGIGNIQEVYEDSKSSSDNNKPSAMDSFLNKFQNPRSS